MLQDDAAPAGGAAPGADPAAPEGDPSQHEGDTAPAAGSSHELANKLQNPIANLISVPSQFNWDTGFGPDDDRDRITLNIQPVIPFELNEDWNLITRTIIPVIYAENPVPNSDDAFGLGDTLLSFWLSPTDTADGWIWGVGAATLLPTGTDDLFRSKQIGLGPTFVALRQDHIGEKGKGGTLTWGALFNHVWGLNDADNVDRVNSSFFQPFLIYTMQGGTSFGMNTESTYNWNNHEWNVPIHAFFRQLVKMGGAPIQWEFGGQWYADAPPGGAEWGVRFAITLLFPK